MVYNPSKKHVWLPEDDYEDLYIEVGSGSKNSPRRTPRRNRINCWHFNKYPGAKTILFFHGNYGNISHRQYIIDICKKFKVNLFLPDYRGYGKSGPPTSINSMLDDAESAYNQLRTKVSSEDIIVWGESLGGCAAAHVASKNPCWMLILMCTFSSVGEILSERTDKKSFYSALGWSANIPGRNFLIKEKLKKVKIPVVIIHSSEDELIPYRCAQINYNSIKHSCKKLYKIKGGHASPDIEERQMAEIFTYVGLIPLCEKDNVDLSDIVCQLKDLGEYVEKLDAANGGDA